MSGTAPAQPVDQGTAGHGGRVKNAAKGAAGGAVAGPEGAAAGALAGLLAGGGKRAAGNRALVAEFVICMVVLGLSPVVGENVTVGKFMKKGSATAAVFVILGFISAVGPTSRKVASGLGLLMTATVLLNERSVFGRLVQAVNGRDVPIAGAGTPATSSSPAPAAPPASGLDWSNPFSLGASLGDSIRHAVGGLVDGPSTPQTEAFVQALQEPGATWGGT